MSDSAGCALSYPLALGWKRDLALQAMARHLPSCLSCSPLSFVVKYRSRGLVNYCIYGVPTLFLLTSDEVCLLHELCSILKAFYKHYMLCPNKNIVLSEA